MYSGWTIEQLQAQQKKFQDQYNAAVNSGAPQHVLDRWLQNLNGVNAAIQTVSTQPSPTPTPEGEADELEGSQQLLNELKARFPWLDQVGFSPEFFQNLVAESRSADEMIAKLREQPQYRSRFPALWREDGSIRMTEAQYLQTENSYRQVLQQYGYNDSYTTPGSLKGLFDTNMDPNELNQRLDTYRKIETGSQAQKDAFYVYAGLRVSTDDLYEAAVDQAKGSELAAKFNQAAAKAQLDYPTFIARATELGLEKITATLTQLQANGIATGTAIQEILKTNPTFAQQMMDTLYQAGETQTLSLSELLTSFELAAVGAAATGAGLALPTKERALELVSAGVTRAKASDVYSQYSQLRNLYSEAVRRAGLGDFTQADIEDAAFLGSAEDQSRLQAGLSREEAAGSRQGSFQVGQDRLGRFTQSGFRSGLDS
jgi:hypothetical protein